MSQREQPRGGHHRSSQGRQDQQCGRWVCRNRGRGGCSRCSCRRRCCLCLGHGSPCSFCIQRQAGRRCGQGCRCLRLGHCRSSLLRSPTLSPPRPGPHVRRNCRRGRRRGRRRGACECAHERPGSCSRRRNCYCLGLRRWCCCSGWVSSPRTRRALQQRVERQRRQRRMRALGVL